MSLALCFRTHVRTQKSRTTQMKIRNAHDNRNKWKTPERDRTYENRS